MGLSDIFDAEKNQILMMDPVPNVNKSYSMICKVEKNRQVSVNVAVNSENVAMISKEGASWKKTFDQKVVAKNDKVQLFYNYCKRIWHIKEKSFKLVGYLTQQICSYCRRDGHIKEKCFKLNEFPPKWESNKKSSAGSAAANLVETPPNETQDSGSKEAIATAVQREISKLIKGKAVAEGSHIVNFAHIQDFAGPSNS